MAAADPLGVLLAALQTRWAAENTLKNLHGLYLHEKPPDLTVGFPYYIVDADPSEIYGYTDASEIWNHTLEFRVYDRTPELAKTALDVLLAVVAAKAFTLTLTDGHAFVSSRRMRAHYRADAKEVERAVARFRMVTCVPRA